MLRDRWPEAHIELAGYPRVTALALAARLVDAAVSLDSAQMARYFSLRPEIPRDQADYVRSFDVILSYLYDPAGTVQENILAVGATQVLYGSPMVKSEHASDHLARPLEELALYPETELRARLTLPSVAMERGRRRLAAIGPEPMILHPGSGSPKKNWPLERFLALATALRDRAGLQPVFTLGEADAAIAERLATSHEQAVPVLSGLSLVELAEVLATCRGYVGNDSGITHLAAALGVPVVALFGPTDPAVWGPRGPHVTVLRTEPAIADAPPDLAVESVFAARPV